MLHKGATRQLSRRALLKGLGMGVSLVALGGLSGCTQFLQRTEQGSSSWLAPSKAPGDTERGRRELIRQAYEVKKAWKDVLRDYYRWQQTKDERVRQLLPAKVQQAKQRTLSLVDDQSFVKSAQDLDRAITSAQVTLATKERFIQWMTPEWVSAGVPAEEIDKWKQAVRESDPEAARTAIMEAGGFIAYVRKLITSFSLEHRVQLSAAQGQSSRFRMQPLLLCEISGITCIVTIGALIYLHVTTEEEQAKDEKGGLAILASTSCGLAAGSCKGKKKEQPQPPPPSGSSGG